MRIAVLAHGLRAGGGKSVATNLIAAFGRQRADHSYLFVVPEDPAFSDLPFPEDALVVPYRQRFGYLGRALFDITRLGQIVQSFDPDVVFGMGNLGIARPGCPQAILFHKAQMIYPRAEWDKEPLSGKLRNALIAHRIRRSLPVTQLVFCQTDVATRRFRQRFGYSGSTAICRNAISTRIRSVADASATNRSSWGYAAGERLALLALTRYYPHKNLELIVECFDRYRDELDGVICLLTISPDDHPRAARLLRTIEARRLDDKVMNVGPVEQAHLPALYRRCGALLLPTFIESFSSAYLEAMAFSCPIITSDLDFAHELCGDAALYFDPRSVEGLRDAILRLRDDAALCASLKSNAEFQLPRVSTSWDSIAKGVLRELDALAGAPARHGRSKELSS